MGFIVKGTERIGGEARQESFYLFATAEQKVPPHDLPNPEFMYEDISHILAVINQICQTSYFKVWQARQMAGGWD